jgi:hypothetical protein
MKPPRARKPRTEPSGHFAGNAGTIIAEGDLHLTAFLDQRSADTNPAMDFPGLAHGGNAIADQVQERKPDAEYKDYLAKCINSIASNSINKLVMLPGWQSSFGARMELLFAKRINIEVVFWPSWVEPSKNDDELIYRSILSYMCDLIDMNGMEHVDIKKLFDLMHTYRQRNMNFSTNQ